MSPDRLSPLDASFLHVEDSVSHMHIASIAVFEGPQPRFADVVAMVETKLALVPRYRQKVKFVPFELGRPVWVWTTRTSTWSTTCATRPSRRRAARTSCANWWAA